MSTSNNGYSDLPETYVSRDNLPEAYAWPNGALEVVRRNEEKEVATTREDDAPEPLRDSSHEADGSEGPKRPTSWRKLLWISIVSVLLILAIALGGGLGVGLPQSDNGDDTGGETQNRPNTTDATDPAWLSTRGAFNGSDIAVTTQARLDANGVLEQEANNSNALLIYQHYTGEIRWMQYLAPETWYGGQADHVLATDAKNGTPIDTIIVRASTFQLHLFYVDKNNLARERFIRLDNSNWDEGPLGGLGYSVLDGPRATLRVGRYTGPMTNADSTSDNQNACAKIFVSKSGTELDELGRCRGTEWEFQKTWSNVDGRAPPAYRGWSLQDLVLYAAFVDLNGNAQVYWIDTTQGQGVDNTAVHPLNIWTLASGITIPNIEPTAGLSDISGAGTLIGRAANNGSITNWNVTLDAENSTVSAGWTFDPPQIMPGSLLKVTSAARNEKQLMIYYQAVGDDITVASGTIAYGPSDPVAWPIPDN